MSAIYTSGLVRLALSERRHQPQKQQLRQLSVRHIRDVLCFTLSDEQEMVQKKTFTNWINSYLTQVTTSTHTSLR